MIHSINVVHVLPREIAGHHSVLHNMSDWNPMQQNLNNPVSRLGIVPGKAQPDWYLIRQGQANADDPTLAAECYPGGAKEINHDIMPGDLSFGRKCIRNHSQAAGEPNEVGVVSLAGIWHPETESHRSLEDGFYLQGVVVTECRVSDPMGNPGATDPSRTTAPTFISAQGSGP